MKEIVQDGAPILREVARLVPEEFFGSAKLAAIYTGISYFATALVLAAPYFLTSIMTLALATSLILGVGLITFVSFYSAVVSGNQFKKDFIEIS